MSLEKYDEMPSWELKRKLQDPKFKRKWELDHIANFEAPDYKPWATFIPERDPQFKIHVDKSKAHAALRYLERPGVLYELQGDTWVKVRLVNC